MLFPTLFLKIFKIVYVKVNTSTWKITEVDFVDPNRSSKDGSMLIKDNFWYTNVYAFVDRRLSTLVPLKSKATVRAQLYQFLKGTALDLYTYGLSLVCFLDCCALNTEIFYTNITNI